MYQDLGNGSFCIVPLESNEAWMFGYYYDNVTKRGEFREMRSQSFVESCHKAPSTMYRKHRDSNGFVLMYSSEEEDELEDPTGWYTSDFDFIQQTKVKLSTIIGSMVDTETEHAAQGSQSAGGIQLTAEGRLSAPMCENGRKQSAEYIRNAASRPDRWLVAAARTPDTDLLIYFVCPRDADARGLWFSDRLLAITTSTLNFVEMEAVILEFSESESKAMWVPSQSEIEEFLKGAGQ